MAQNWHSEFSQIIREVIGLTILRFLRSQNLENVSNEMKQGLEKY
jgi:hypothetical protein